MSLQKIDLNHAPEMEYWYYAQHSAQVARRFGPWLARHESYLPVYSPEEAAEFGLYNWRYVNCYWTDMPTGDDGELAFSPPPHTLYCANAFTPAFPTEVFKGQNEKPENHSVLRWIQLIKYPAHISQKEGEDWYLNTFVPEAVKQPHMYRFISYKTLPVTDHLPGHWAAEDLPQVAATSSDGWVRYSEMWYDNYNDWREDVLIHPPKYTKPDWAEKETFPFLLPEIQFVSSFILEKPTDNYLTFDRVYK